MADSAFMALFRKKESEKGIGWSRTHNIVCVRCANRLRHSSSVLSPFNFSLSWPHFAFLVTSYLTVRHQHLNDIDIVTRYPVFIILLSTGLLLRISRHLLSRCILNSSCPHTNPHVNNFFKFVKHLDIYLLNFKTLIPYECPLECFCG